MALDGGQRQHLPNGLVTEMSDEETGIGIERTTNQYGKASFVLGHRLPRVSAISANPLHSAWPMRPRDLIAVPGSVEIAVLPIDPGGHPQRAGIAAHAAWSASLNRAPCRIARV